MILKMIKIEQHKMMKKKWNKKFNTFLMKLIFFFDFNQSLGLGDLTQMYNTATLLKDSWPQLVLI